MFMLAIRQFTMAKSCSRFFVNSKIMAREELCTDQLNKYMVNPVSTGSF